MSLRPKKGHVVLSILGVHTHMYTPVLFLTQQTVFYTCLTHGLEMSITSFNLVYYTGFCVPDV